MGKTRHFFFLGGQSLLRYCECSEEGFYLFEAGMFVVEWQPLLLLWWMLLLSPMIHSPYCCYCRRCPFNNGGGGGRNEGEGDRDCKLDPIAICGLIECAPKIGGSFAHWMVVGSQ